MKVRNESAAPRFLTLTAVLIILATMLSIPFIGGCAVTNHRGKAGVTLTSPDENGVTTGAYIWTPFNELLPQHRGGPAPDLSSVPGPEVQAYSSPTVIKPRKLR